MSPQACMYVLGGLSKNLFHIIKSKIYIVMFVYEVKFVYFC
jgi:hypothetical protein